MKFLNKQNFSWRSAILEVVLIFLGITLAIWFENYKDNRQERKTEILLLKEMLKDEKRNVEDMEYSLDAFLKASNSCDYILNHLDNEKPYDDSLGIHFSQISRSPIFQYSRSSYNTFQSIGWQIISNDSLRTKIIYLYDYFYDAMEILGHDRDYQYMTKYINPIYNRTFNTKDKTPLYYNSLLKDIEIRNYIVAARKLLLSEKVRHSEFNSESHFQMVIDSELNSE